jgi:ParB family chromosome partitioning protein
MPDTKATSPKKTAKKGLGRGLGSLLGAMPPEKPAEQKLASEPNAPAKQAPPSQLAKASTKAASKIEFQEATNKSLQAGIIEKDTQPAKTEAAKTVANIPETQRIWQIPIEKLKAQAQQPRKDFATDALKELSASIKEQGILQPIVARKNADKQFEIIAGERRWRAAQMAGLNRVPVILKATDEQTAKELALIENIQREDLNPIEEAEAFESLIKQYKLTQQELADRLGKDRVSIANTLRLLKLHPDLRAYVKTGEISQGQAKVLLSIDESALQKKVGMETVRKKLTVRATEKLVAKVKQSRAIESIESESEEIQVSKRLAKALAGELQKKLKTRVAIDYNEGKGRIKINFHSDVELNEIVDKLRQS